MSLTAANRARLEKSLNTTYRFESDTDSPIYCKLGEYLEKNASDGGFLDIPKMVYEYFVEELGKPTNGEK